MDETSSILSHKESSMEIHVSTNSTINIETDTTDYFNGIFYHIDSITQQQEHYDSKSLFNNVLQVLRNEFLTPEDRVKFVLTTHVDGGKRCNIHVDVQQMTFSVTGPGNKVGWTKISEKWK